MRKADRPVRTPYRTPTVDLVVRPWFSVEDSRPEILHELCSGQRAMNKGQRDCKVFALRILVSFCAIHTNTDPVVRLAERFEETEDIAPLPIFHIDLLFPIDGHGHRSIIDRLHGRAVRGLRIPLTFARSLLMFELQPPIHQLFTDLQPDCSRNEDFEDDAYAIVKKKET